MRSRIAQWPMRRARVGGVIALMALVASAAACTFLRSLDDLGNGVHGDGGDTTDGGNGTIDGKVDAPTCGPEINLQNDPKNCGQCGATCLAGDSCESATCTFAVVQIGVDELAIGGGWLVYNDGNVIHARKTSGGERFTVATTSAVPGALATDGESVYWTINAASGGLFRCALPACAGGMTTIASAQDHPNGVALDGMGRVYWTVGGTAPKTKCTIPGIPKGQLMSAPLDGGSSSALVMPGAAYNSVIDVTQVAIHTPDIFWTTDSCASDAGSGPATVWRQPLAGGQSPPTSVVTISGGYYFKDLLADETNVYYAVLYGPIQTAPEEPQSAPVRQWEGTTDGVQAARMTIDATRAYWTNEDGSDAGAVALKYLYGLPKTSPSKTKPTLLWSRPKVNKQGLTGTTADERAIYFGDTDEKRIRALLK